MCIVNDMTLHFARTPYATMTALAVARALYRAKDLPGAKVQLQWVMQHALDNAYQQIARLRLAGLLYEEKAYHAAQKLLAIQPLKAFKWLYADRLGDILVAQNNFQAARRSYKEALDTLDINDLSARIVRLKLDALGSA
jgi:predicted negative regulator of RcsB-dependent stress response